MIAGGPEEPAPAIRMLNPRMLSKRLRRRLRDLDRTGAVPERPAGGVPGPQTQQEPAAEAADRLTDRIAQAQVRLEPRPAPPPPPSGLLEELAPGQAVQTEHGTLYLIEALPVEVLPGSEPIIERLGRLMASGPTGSDDPLAPLRGLPVSDLLLLDTETAGLAAAPVFLVGLVMWRGDAAEDATVLQLLARDYSEERAMLAETARLLARGRLLMTYNGRSFDLPMLRERTVYHGLPRLTEPERHLDLLGVARSRLRGRLEDCKLQTLERCLCGRERWADIEGAEIPQAYHDFVADGDAGRIRLVLEHNRLDLMTMLEVLPHLAGDR